MTKIESASFNWYNNQYTITLCAMCVHVCKSVCRSVAGVVGVGICACITHVYIYILMCMV